MEREIGMSERRDVVVHTNNYKEMKDGERDWNE